jgi:hypothetical protein
VFSPVPASAEDRLTLFTVEAEDQCRERALYVHRTGLVELLWALAPQPVEGEGDGFQIDAAEIATIIVQLAAAIGRRPYSEIAKIGRGRRRFGRVDWWFHLATGVSGGEGSRYWTGLVIDGQTPPRAGQQYPAAPPHGYCGQELRNSRRSRDPHEIARALLARVLAENGYYEFSSAIDETMERVNPVGSALAASGEAAAQVSD